MSNPQNMLLSFIGREEGAFQTVVMLNGKGRDTHIDFAHPKLGRFAVRSVATEKRSLVEAALVVIELCFKREKMEKEWNDHLERLYRERKNHSYDKFIAWMSGDEQADKPSQASESQPKNPDSEIERLSTIIENLVEILYKLHHGICDISAFNQAAAQFELDSYLKQGFLKIEG